MKILILISLISGMIFGAICQVLAHHYHCSYWLLITTGIVGYIYFSDSPFVKIFIKI